MSCHGYTLSDPDYPDLDLLLIRIEKMMLEHSLNPSLALLDSVIEEASKNSKLVKLARDQGVRETEDFKRVAGLPRRVWTDEDSAKLVADLTYALRQPEGRMHLKASQAIALLEMGLLGGLLGALRAGAGKTLITFLAGAVLFSKTPLLLVPAKLLDKTKAELKEYLKHFRCTYFLHIKSYESLSRVSHATYLENLKPDLIILDEAHKVKNPRAAVTKRLKRYIEKEKPKVVALSGTVTKRSLFDYAHLAKWCLGNYAPLPSHFNELEEWANAIDERPRSNWRTPPGALVKFSNGSDDIQDVREGFARRVIETPGVVATNDKLADCSLTVTRWQIDPPSEVEEAFKELRPPGWKLPDGLELCDAMQVAQKARQLGQGFYLHPVPWPPKDWLEPRSAWGKFVRETLKHNRRGLDSELMVAQACARGWLDDTAYRAWRDVKDTFVLHSEVVWLSDFVLRAAQDWLETDGSEGKLIWTEHVEFAEELSRRTGLPYCGAGGIDANGTPVEAFAGKPCIVSRASSGEGRNLQAWYRSLVINPMSSGRDWEQTLARTHRDGQEEDEVEYTVLVTCIENESAFTQALNDALYRSATTQQPDRLTYCDLIWPTLVSRKPFVSVVQSDLLAWNK